MSHRVLAWLSTMMMLATLASPAHSEPEQSLAELDLNLEELEDHEPREYTYAIERDGETHELGTLQMRTSLEEERVVLADRWQLNWQGREINLALTVHSRRDALLSPIRIESEGQGDDEVATFTVEFDDTGEATVAGALPLEGRHRAQEIDLPQDMVTDVAILRIVSLLPREQGMTVRFDHWLETGELNLKHDHRIVCGGAETVTVDGDQQTWTRFDHSGGGISRSTYWVDDDGVLQRVRIDDRKVLDLKRREPAGAG